jgi:hypothetical protein
MHAAKRSQSAAGVKLLPRCAAGAVLTANSGPEPFPTRLKRIGALTLYPIAFSRGKPARALLENASEGADLAAEGRLAHLTKLR